MQQVSFPDINKSPTEQTLAPPCKNTPIRGIPEVPGAVDPKTTTCLTPPRNNRQPMRSWNDGLAKQAIVDFVKTTTDQSSPQLCSAGGADRHLRPGWDAVGRASDVFTGDLLSGSRARSRETETRTRKCRAIQDGTVRRP